MQYLCYVEFLLSLNSTLNSFCSAGDLRDLLEITDTVNSQISLLWSEGHSWTLFLDRGSSSHIIFLQRLNSGKICLSSEIKNFQNQKTDSNANYELPMADLVRLVVCQQQFRPTESLFLWIHTSQKNPKKPSSFFISFSVFHLSITFWTWIFLGKNGKSGNIKLFYSPKIFIRIVEFFLRQIGVTIVYKYTAWKWENNLSCPRHWTCHTNASNFVGKTKVKMCYQ